MDEKTAAADKPPAYSSIGDRQAGHLPDPQHRAVPDQVHICDRKHDIEGTFYVNPEVTNPSRRRESKSCEPFPDASFRTVHSAIDLQLATTGDARKHPKANIRVATRHGNMKVTLLPIPPSRPRIGLNMLSRHGQIIDDLSEVAALILSVTGHVVLFLPEDFVGVVQLSTRRGNINVLPFLKCHMKLVKSSERNMIIMVGNANEDLDGVCEVSYCEIYSRWGDVVVGVDGQDHYAAPARFWKKIGEALKGTGN